MKKIASALIMLFTAVITVEFKSANLSTIAKNTIPISVTTIPIKQHFKMDKNPDQFIDFNFCITPPTLVYFIILSLEQSNFEIYKIIK